jgi:maltose alpha-D-glucosyltransferase/alpha-amylase
MLKASPLQERKAEVLALIDSCAAPRGRALRIRHHGDYHLGQVLLANNDWYIIDFEGEPSRPLAESRRRTSPLRDVAGMLRSFSYAKWSATKGNDLDEWERETRRAFLEAYAAAAKDGGLFDSFEDVAGLLRLFELEKVLYELRYELGNRPDWVQVPLSGLLAMLEEKR